MGPSRGDVDDQLRPDLVVGGGEYLLRDGPSFALGESDMVDAQVGCPPAIAPQGGTEEPARPPRHDG